MALPKLYTEQVLAKFRAGTVEAIRDVLRPGQNRADFLRDWVDFGLEQQRLHLAGKEAQGIEPGADLATGEDDQAEPTPVEPARAAEHGEAGRRPRIFTEQVLAKFRDGTVDAIKSALLPGQTRADFLRHWTEYGITVQRRERGAARPAKPRASDLIVMPDTTWEQYLTDPHIVRIGSHI